MATRKRTQKPKVGEVYRQDRFGNKHTLDAEAAAAAEVEPPTQPALPAAD